MAGENKSLVVLDRKERSSSQPGSSSRGRGDQIEGDSESFRGVHNVEHFEGLKILEFWRDPSQPDLGWWVKVELCPRTKKTKWMPYQEYGAPSPKRRRSASVPA